jgi:hypothetical protein
VESDGDLAGQVSDVGQEGRTLSMGEMSAFVSVERCWAVCVGGLGYKRARE